MRRAGLPNRGADILAQARANQGLSQAAVARRINVTREAVHHWESGRSLPRPHHALALERLLGVPMRAWAER